MSQWSLIAATMTGELVSPKGTREGKNTCHLEAVKIVATPYGGALRNLRIWCEIVFAAVSVNKDVTVIAIAALPCELLSPKGIQEEREYLLSNSQDCSRSLWWDQGKEGQDVKTGYWPQIGEMRMKGMVSVSPDSCILPYIKKITKFLNLRYLFFLN